MIVHCGSEFLEPLERAVLPANLPAGIPSEVLAADAHPACLCWVFQHYIELTPDIRATMLEFC